MSGPDNMGNLIAQLKAFGRVSVEGGDMTPTAERVLLRILSNYSTSDPADGGDQ